jgi:hypothetical protein
MRQLARTSAGWKPPALGTKKDYHHDTKNTTRKKGSEEKNRLNFTGLVS